MAQELVPLRLHRTLGADPADHTSRIGCYAASPTTKPHAQQPIEPLQSTYVDEGNSQEIYFSHRHTIRCNVMHQAGRGAQSLGRLSRLLCCENSGL